MDEKRAREIVHFYLEITGADDTEILKYLLTSKKAIRYFNLKQNGIIKKDWNINKLKEKSRLYNNVVTDNTFKEWEDKISSVDIVIPVKNICDVEASK